ncbi:MAG: plastocyanin/azurin family copper-binding protein [Chloroflexota bacterium]|nr:plastocyanin/azurin family copper-binding protein [Chloroflexota bacterium]
MMRRPALLAVLATLLIGAAGCGPAGPQRVTITIHYSSFDPSALTVQHGVPVTFVLVNEDPIDHEWIVGDQALHERHRHGTEPVHGARPTEVTVPAGTTIETTVTFDQSAHLTYVCHLPHHEAYGMVGTLTVT